jgi:hypothetical protein
VLHESKLLDHRVHLRRNLGRCAVGARDSEYLSFGDLQRKLLDRFYRVAEE